MSDKLELMMHLCDLLADEREGEALGFVEDDPTLLHVRSKLFNTTLMHEAAGHDCPEFLSRALRMRAPVSPRDDRQQTPLHRAAKGHWLACAELLAIHGAELDAVDMMGYTPLMYVFGDAGRLVADMLIDRGATLDLNSAVLLEKVDHVRNVVRSDPQAIRQAPFPRRLLNDAVLVQSIELARLLLEAGADPNDGGDPAPPLFGAVSGNKRSPDIVRLLLEHGADPNAKHDLEFDDKGPQTIMEYERAYPVASEEILAVLREFGAR